MGQDKYIKFILTVIAFSLFLIAINLSVTGFVLYDLYNEEMNTLFSKISSRIDEISSSIDDVVEAIKKRWPFGFHTGTDSLCTRDLLPTQKGGKSYEKAALSAGFDMFWFGLLWGLWRKKSFQDV